MVDLHCHILPGIDDGPRTLADSLAMATDAAADGIETIVATPHVSMRYRNSVQAITSAVKQLAERLNATSCQHHSTGVLAGAPERLPRVLCGAEVAASVVGSIPASELELLSIAGGGWLLLEPPFNASGAALDLIIGQIRRMGLHVILAHPERCPAFHRDPQLLRALVHSGVLTSLTAGSLIGRFGGHVRRFATWMVEEEIVHNVASDAHNVSGRPPRIRAEIAAAGLAWMGDWLAREVPLAVIGGLAIPPRPAQPHGLALRRRWRTLAARKRR